MVALALVAEPGDRELGAAGAEAEQAARLPLAPGPAVVALRAAADDSEFLAHPLRHGGIGPDTDDPTRRVAEQR